MQKLTPEKFHQLIAQTPMKARLRDSLRFVASTSTMTDEDWSETELVAIADRTSNKGVLIVALDDEIRVLPYELTRGIKSSKTGRAQPIICDFCRTWQSGVNAGSIVFSRDGHSVRRVGFLCCADLACSWHVRSKTSASRMSRAQLREDLTNEQRVGRLKDRLRHIISEVDKRVNV